MVPVDAGVGERDLVGEAAADRDRRLRLVRSVVAVLEPQPVPMDGRLQIAVVDDLDRDLRSLADAQRRTGDGAVVGEHAHSRVGELLRDGRDPQLDRVVVCDFDDLARDSLA